MAAYTAAKDREQHHTAAAPATAAQLATAAAGIAWSASSNRGQRSSCSGVGGGADDPTTKLTHSHSHGTTALAAALKPGQELGRDPPPHGHLSMSHRSEFGEVHAVDFIKTKKRHNANHRVQRKKSLPSCCGRRPDHRSLIFFHCTRRDHHELGMPKPPPPQGPLFTGLRHLLGASLRDP